MMPLACKDLTKRYGRKIALDRLTLSLNRGEVYGLVGRNGSGKSTLLKMLSGLARPTSGMIQAFGHEISYGSCPPRLGALVETPGITPSLSGFQNVMVRATALGLANPDASSREALRSVGLDKAAKASARTYSLGMKQRLGIALAIVGAPDILLLDEPFNGLDPEGVRNIRGLIVESARRYGCAVLVSSHVLDQLDRMVDRYGVIREGRLAHEIAADEVEALCADYLCVASPEAPRALAALEQRVPKASFAMMPDDTIRISGPISADEAGRILLDAGVPVRALYTHSCDIEDFFIGLMGGSEPVRNAQAFAVANGKED